MLGALIDANKNNNGSAINGLGAFINEVVAQSGAAFPKAEGQALINTARIVIDLLGG